MRAYAYVLFVGAWDPAVCNERLAFREDQGCWCSWPGPPATDPDDWSVGLCAAKKQNS